MTNELPAWLGGHLNKTHVDSGALKFFKEEIGCLTMLDIGCGPGGQVDEALKLGYTKAKGLDGDFTLDRAGLNGEFQLIDFTKTKYDDDFTYDLGWSCEFLEHVEAQYTPNFMPAFQQCRIVAMTFCPPQPDKPNPHHFNEQPAEYWIDVFKDYGFKLDVNMTEEARARSTMKKPFFQSRGMVFVK